MSQKTEPRDEDEHLGDADEQAGEELGHERRRQFADERGVGRGIVEVLKHHAQPHDEQHDDLKPQHGLLGPEPAIVADEQDDDDNPDHHRKPVSADGDVVECLASHGQFP